MKSPFPGMDPYLERHWSDVHQALVTYIRDQLQPKLPEDLRARMQVRAERGELRITRETFAEHFDAWLKGHHRASKGTARATARPVSGG